MNYPILTTQGKPSPSGLSGSKPTRTGLASVLFALWLAILITIMPSVTMAGQKDYIVRSPDGVDIAVQEAGNPAGPPIVFIHGLLGSHLNWENQLASPDLSHYRLITFDLRGHGLSGKPRDAQAYRDGRLWADDLRAVLEATKADNPVLVGWSLGGAVVSNYIAAYGDDGIGGLVYVGGVVELKAELITSHPEVYAGLASDKLKAHLDAMRDFLALCFATPPDEVTFERLLSNAAMASWMMTRTVPSMTVSAADGLPKITAPVLMLYGEKDALVMVRPSLERAKALNPAIRQQIYADSGHAPFLEEAQRFNRDLADFRELATTHRR
ncbi:alpha/beta hydrolase [Phyllobacterium sp. 0TCS1.6C]|uniref:alpha/beta fold hydrolase n=1 Tax=unclassified Phyllobacterium TaxID=2638441 RepID=UPI002264CBC5|nr:MULTISPECIES: alpha/beta hydrolase [unclassified Phyllobacterium]MCX8278940.1 alpha/beta hydrolase [Phyllobacterium sp. 0TCS1.6C]MCX8293724.1 alpha/beta hydrolase [Phyllobacterium sp. 0TCS1.6A]